MRWEGGKEVELAIQSSPKEEASGEEKENESRRVSLSKARSEVRIKLGSSGAAHI